MKKLTKQFGLIPEKITKRKRLNKRFVEKETLLFNFFAMGWR
jgi:hypothetical protein